MIAFNHRLIISVEETLALETVRNSMKSCDCDCGFDVWY